MDEALLDCLREDLLAADFSIDSVLTLLGDAADEARQRGAFAAARRVLNQTANESPVVTLIKLFLLGETMAARRIDEALPRLGASGAESLGLIARGSDGCRAQLSLNPVQLPNPEGSSLNPVQLPIEQVGPPKSTVDWWIISDLDDQLRRGPARSDHVMGVGGATRSLIAQLPFSRRQLTILGFEQALDLGTGCGIVALYLARAGAQRVIATDISARALMIARANARLNGQVKGIEFRQGDLFDPVVGEKFLVIASNPPFVITPRTGGDDVCRYEYRDAGMTGDALAERVVREAPGFLAAGGTFICLANWESHWGTNGLDRVQEWVESATGEAGVLGAWVIERDRIDPARYAETWARDGGAKPGESEFEDMMDSWLNDFAARQVTAIGLGSIRIKRLEGRGWLGVDLGSSTSIRLEHAREPFAPSDLGAYLEQTFLTGLAVDRMPDEEVLARRWFRVESVDEVREHTPGEESPRAIWLRTVRPIQRSIVADPILAAAVGACDGELSLEQIADALATILEVDPEACAQALVQGVRELVWLGMLRQAFELAAR